MTILRGGGVFIGIDPGVNGGMAAIRGDTAVVAVTPMPDTDADVLAWLYRWRDDSIPHAVLEWVRSSPQMGVKSAFTFGCGYGGLRMALAAARVPFDEVTPQRWQRAMGCLTRGDKNVTKQRAQQLFPGVRLTHATADALLLAEYGRRYHMGLISVAPAEAVQRARTGEF